MKRGRKHFTPTVGEKYRNNRNGKKYKCLQGFRVPYMAIMQESKSGQMIVAQGCGIYPDGTIDWDFATEGNLPKEDKE